MRRPFRLIAATAAGALLLFAGGCAEPTHYQRLSSTSPAEGGFSDERLSEDRFRVTFAGNTLTSRERVESYLLFRAAELTIEQGHDWFLIIDHEMDHVIQREIRPDPYYRPWYGAEYGEWRPYWRYRYGPGPWNDWDPYHGDPFFMDDTTVNTLERFEATAEIKLGDGQPPAGEARYFVAREVIARIGPTIEYPHD